MASVAQPGGLYAGSNSLGLAGGNGGYSSGSGVSHPSQPPSPAMATALGPDASPVYATHQQSNSVNGHGIDLAVRPGTALGSSHFASPPNSALSPTTHGGNVDGIDYAGLPRWDDAQVAAWLTAALPTLANNYADTFASNDIRGSVLLEVDQSALKEMGVKSVGDRVKICVAVRSLRTKYNSALAAVTSSSSPTMSSGASLSRRPSALGRIGPSPLLNRVPYSPPSVPSSASSPTSLVSSPPQPSISSLRPGSTSLSYSARNISVGNRIPPPLHLAQSNAVSSGGISTQLSPPSATTSPKSATFAMPTPSFGEATSPMRAMHAVYPAQPAPTGRIPPTPTKTTTALPSPSRPHHFDTSPILTQAPQQYQNQGLTTSVSASSLASRPPQTYGSGHRKANSSSVPAPAGGAAPTNSSNRPPFAGQAVSYAGHPYAASASSSAASTLVPSTLNSGSSSSTLTSTSGLLPSAIPALPPRFASAPALPVSSSASAPSATQLSNLDVMRKAVKFTSADGITTRVLAVADARDGREVLARVMKKFGGREGEDLDGWGVWTTEVTGAGACLSRECLNWTTND